MFIASLITLSLGLLQAPSTPRVIGPRQAGVVNLRLECRPSGNVWFEISNGGSVDTTLLLGANVGNGNKYTISGLKLTIKQPSRPDDEYDYFARGYPVAIGGRLDPWLQPLPVRFTLSVAATAQDFFSAKIGRLRSFPEGSELQLTWTVPAPREESLLLVYWSGTLKSNSCTIGAAGGDI